MLQVETKLALRNDFFFFQAIQVRRAQAQIQSSAPFFYNYNLAGHISEWFTKYHSIN